MQNYPNSLFSALATNILHKMNGKKSMVSILKEATDRSGLNKQAQTPFFSTVTPADDVELKNMLDFLAANNYQPKQFLSSKPAQELVNAKTEESKNRINQMFSEQARLAGGLTPDLATNRDSMLKQLKQTVKPAIMGEGIRDVMHTRAINPQRFEELKTLSDRSDAALSGHPAPIVTGLAGAAAGGLTGAALGANKLRRWGMGVPMGLLGGLAAGYGGRKLAEKETGYQYGDILGPVQLADRMKRQIASDPGK